MAKMHYFTVVTNFQKLPSLITFDFGDLELCDLAKLCFFKLTMTKSSVKKQL